MKWSIVFILSLFCASINAQDEVEKLFGGSSERLFRAGLVAGFNASQLDGDQFRGYSKLGGHIGLKALYRLPSNEKIALGTEMLFSMKGSSSDLNLSSSNNNQVKIKLNYIEIPVFMTCREWRMDFHGGFSYGRLIGSSTTILTTPYLEEDFRKDDLNIILGLSYLFNDNFGATFRYSRSFVNAVKKDVNKDALVGHLLTFRIEYLF